MAGFTPVNPVERPKEPTKEFPKEPRQLSDDDETGTPQTNEPRPAHSPTTSPGNGNKRRPIRKKVTAKKGTNATAAAATDAAQPSSHNNPYMYPQQRTRANPPFDLSSVATKHTVNHDVEPRQDRPFGLREVPTLRPTKEEFADPMKYIASIAATGKRFGAVKIVPPNSWDPPFSLDTEVFWFKTRRQVMNSGGGERAKDDFIEKLYDFHSKQGTPIIKLPSIDRRPLDLFHLYECVKLRGGFEDVCKKKLWAQIGRELGYSGRIMTSLSTSLKSAYQKLLTPYDEYLQNGSSDDRSPFSTRNSEKSTPSPSAPPSENVEREDFSPSLKRPALEGNNYDSPTPSKRTKVDNDRPDLFRRIAGSEVQLYRVVLDNPQEWHHGMDIIDDKQPDFTEAPTYNLRQFQQKAGRFHERYFSTLESRSPSENNVESEFWRLLSDPSQFVEVEYGADIHTSVQGSPFPQVERDFFSPYIYDQWNLNVMPYLEESYCRYVESPIPFLAQPWIKIGMVFSSQSWHAEDFYSYLVSYHHFGDPKTWYTVPESDAEKFRQVLIDTVGKESIEENPSLLLESNVMLSPGDLLQKGISCYAVDQRAGEIVVTFPKVFYAQMNHGFNLNEVVNLLPFFDWIKYGQECQELYYQYNQKPPFSIERLLLRMSGTDAGLANATKLAELIQEVQSREMSLRSEVRKMYPKMIQEIDDSLEEYNCKVTKTFCFLSQIVEIESGDRLSLRYFLTLPSVDSAKFKLVYRHDDDGLKALCSQISDRASLPNQWYAKVSKYFYKNPRPSLRALKSLVSEGEKIPFTVYALGPLKKFVEKGSEWVEEVQSLLSRKLQNRKHSIKSAGGNSEEVINGSDDHRQPAHFEKLLDEASKLPFSCPEIYQLHDRAMDIVNYKKAVENLLSKPDLRPVNEYWEMLELGISLNVLLPEIDALQKIVSRLKWLEIVSKMNGKPVHKEEVKRLIGEAEECGVPDDDELLLTLKQQESLADQIEWRAQAMLGSDYLVINNLEKIRDDMRSYPGSEEIAMKVQMAVESHYRIMAQAMKMHEMTKSDDLEQRPLYSTVRELVSEARKLNTRPNMFLVEKDLRIVEEWMRRGKRYFGKGNAPLYILRSHLILVDKRNNDCLSLDDTYDGPPKVYKEYEASAEGAEDSETGKLFCICRRPESGLMVECEVCHEWYHGKCLKFGRNKGKAYSEKFVCPVCDWRVPITREAQRPRVEDLERWLNQAENLPLLPDEVSSLKNIVKKAREFRSALLPLLKGRIFDHTSLPEARFYLRKLEGAEVLLVDELNMLRREIHRLHPIAASPPPPADTPKTLVHRKPQSKQVKHEIEIFSVAPEPSQPGEATPSPDVTKLQFQVQSTPAADAEESTVEKPGVTGDEPTMKTGLEQEPDVEIVYVDSAKQDQRTASLVGQAIEVDMDEEVIEERKSSVGLELAEVAETEAASQGESAGPVEPQTASQVE